MTDTKEAAVNHGSCNVFRRIMTALTRLAALAYTIMAVFATMEILNLIFSSGAIQKDGFLFAPLKLCTSPSIDIDGPNGTIGINGTEAVLSMYSEAAEEGCQNMYFIIYSCAVSLTLSGIASALYIFMDLMARHSCGGYITSSTSGMGMFLFFILVQAGISTGALAEHINMHVKFQKETFKDAEYIFLWTTAILALSTAVLVIVDSAMHQCCRRRVKKFDEMAEV